MQNVFVIIKTHYVVIGMKKKHSFVSMDNCFLNSLKHFNIFGKGKKTHLQFSNNLKTTYSPIAFVSNETFTTSPRTHKKLMHAGKETSKPGIYRDPNPISSFSKHVYIQ